MRFGAMQASKANTKVTKKNPVLCTIKMTDYYIDEKYLTIKITQYSDLVSI
jgi:hypothetical protein